MTKKSLSSADNPFTKAGKPKGRQSTVFARGKARKPESSKGFKKQKMNKNQPHKGNVKDENC